MGLPPQQLASIVKSVAVLLACGLMLYMLSPPFHWQLATGASRSGFSRDCSACLCDCLAESESMLLPGYGNSLFSDCAKVQEDVDARSVDTLVEELKLLELTGEESQRRADAALLDAKKVASQYQKEAEKCSSGMETCEEARERSEAALAAQKKISAMWEKRARQLGWRDKHQSLFERIGFSGVRSDVQGDSFLFRRKGLKL
ncbi:hypothetical protein GOP47_0001479 [Adiantum capillus-veneris]|uniref:Uncharacterized protein n=1 Tax=Adiantum capillus-veneris TaxID=13818 RepID=A0A9D4V8C1_ADICA|nr:hypothetical protein GOP47_0001479 [Adiantum capillus-veneris]